MSVLLGALAWAATLAGATLLLAGGIGLLRLPDFYSRMHAAGIIDTLAAALLLAGLALQAGLGLITVKLALILALVLFTSPVATHALARAALHRGLEPLVGDDTEQGSSAR